MSVLSINTKMFPAKTVGWMIQFITLAAVTGLIISLFDSSGAALHKKFFFKSISTFTCLWAPASSFMFRGQKTYFSSESTLRRFSSRDYKRFESMGSVIYNTLIIAQTFVHKNTTSSTLSSSFFSSFCPLVASPFKSSDLRFWLQDRFISQYRIQTLVHL